MAPSLASHPIMENTEQSGHGVNRKKGLAEAGNRINILDINKPAKIKFLLRSWHLTIYLTYSPPAKNI